MTLQLSTLEISILVFAAGLATLLNVLASLRCIRALKRYSLPYLALVWLAPVVGAIYVFAKIRHPRHDRNLIPLNTPTQGLDPQTIQGDPWPTLSQPLPPPGKRRH